MKHKINGSIRKNLTFSACALAVWVATTIPAVAESVDLRVKGTIIPAACVPNITGEINYGNVTAAQLSSDEYTVLDKKEVDFAISCDAFVRVAIKAINGQPGTVAGGEAHMPDTSQKSPVDLLGHVKPQVAGLGAADGVNVGGYALALVADGLSADGGALKIITSTNNFNSWSDQEKDFVSLYHPYAANTIYSWERTVGAAAIQNLTGKLAVQAYLNKKSVLDTSKAIQLSGLTTIELVYL